MTTSWGRGGRGNAIGEEAAPPDTANGSASDTDVSQEQSQRCSMRPGRA